MSEHTFKINKFESAKESQQQFMRDMKTAIGSVNGAMKLVSRCAYHAFVHYYRHSHDTSLIAKLYNSLVNETCDDKMARALKEAAKACCAVTIQLDISKSKKTDELRTYKATKNKKDWEEIQEEGKYYLELQKLETCFDDELSGREIGLGAFLEYAPRAPKSGGVSNTTPTQYHKRGKEMGDLIVKSQALLPKVHNEAWHAKLERLIDQQRQLKEVIKHHYEEGTKLLQQEVAEEEAKELEAQKAANNTGTTTDIKSEADNDEEVAFDEVQIG